ncbi:phosphate-starvation-inducible PsiE family protein [Burkholderia gladioli]|uniref:phosphate-starvation-inducible PsiE family protein n=1 Tax=Burkholderia gladioli TaxID=28095 RepID=UPI003EE0791F
MLGLIVIGLGTAIALANLVWSVIRTEQVTLTDLLLMFLFLEVFAMVSQYLKSGQLPVRFPLYIAIGSIAQTSSFGLQRIRRRICLPRHLRLY